MKVYLADPREFRATIDPAMKTVTHAVESLRPPVYVRNDVVHDRFVAGALRRQGAILVERLPDVPDAAIVTFSGHCVSTIRGTSPL